jgi:hypothetical protein
VLKRFAIVLAVSLSGAWLGATPAAAECIVVLAPCWEFRQAAAVLDGTVETSEAVETQLFDGLPAHRARLRVHRSWKGIGAATSVDIFTLYMVEDSVTLSPGRRYLFYARRDDEGRLWAQGCERTIPFEKAAAEIAFLEAKGRPGATGSFYGEAVRWTKSEAMRWDTDNKTVALVGLEVVLKRQGAPPRTVRTDERGAFAFQDIEPGVSYEVLVVPPPGLHKSSPSAGKYTFVLREARECILEGFDFFPASAGRRR